MRVARMIWHAASSLLSSAGLPMSSKWCRPCDTAAFVCKYGDLNVYTDWDIPAALRGRSLDSSKNLRIVGWSDNCNQANSGFVDDLDMLQPTGYLKIIHSEPISIRQDSFYYRCQKLRFACFYVFPIFSSNFFITPLKNDPELNPSSSLASLWGSES